MTLTPEYIRSLDLEAIDILLTALRNNYDTSLSNLVENPTTDEDVENNLIEQEILDNAIQGIVVIETELKKVLNYDN